MHSFWGLACGFLVAMVAINALPASCIRVGISLFLLEIFFVLRYFYFFLEISRIQMFGVQWQDVLKIEHGRLKKK